MHCADYTEDNGRVYNTTNCRGWPRDFNQYFEPGYIFAQDLQYYVYQPVILSRSPCLTNLTSVSYNSQYPMASYNPGQEVCLAWPAKNHVASVCKNDTTNADHGVKIWRSVVNPTGIPTQADFHNNLVYDFGANVGTEGVGFQNCPNFCKYSDGAVCTGCFTVPANITLGKYTFLWEWAQGCDTCWFTTCFDVNIVANTGNHVLRTYTHESPDQYLALINSGAADIPTTYVPPTPPPASDATHIVHSLVLLVIVSLFFLVL